MTHLTDEEVMERFQQDEQEAFDELVRRYRDRLFTFIDQMVRNRPLAQDLLQETFIRLWRHKLKYRNIARFSTWIYTIAGNLVRSEMRRQAREPRVDLEPREPGDRPIELPHPGPAVDSQVHRNMTIELVRAAIDQLPDEFREVIILRELEELSYDEIVEMLGVPLGTVKSRINRARGRLMTLLAKNIKDESP
ncbi:MAG: sigma-70 family RNA polymerase sigma factor [bacterium]|jgi:RNA polymerase sigma-70 factor (ECF subfamily)|nr:sigma-70 family RNA polymerase sigma factor [bacterium]